MRYVLLVCPPSEGWVIWAWADDDGGYLRTEQAKLIEMGYQAKIYLEM